ncbi:MAG: radical SAM protein [Candidatus Shapirobacteria bacterium]
MNIKSILNSCHPKTFLAVNFGCRVNAAETNQLCQFFLNSGLSPFCLPLWGQRGTKGDFSPDLVIINTCSVTAKANIESLGKIRSLSNQFPNSQIVVTGCACPANLKNINNLTFLTNYDKELLLKPLHSSYTHKIKDKFSHTNRFILKIQSGCNHGCTYCIVPSRRPALWSLPTKNAIDTVNQAVKNGYQEIIITGINLDLYEPGLSNLLESLLTQTTIPLISFGSVPLNCIDQKFIHLLSTFPSRLSNFLHIPIQSGSDKILKLMHRPYDQKKIIKTFISLKKISSPLVKGGTERGFGFGTDIIVGFPGETDSDFQQTYDLCKKIGFSKIHVFKFSPRPNTPAQILFDQFPKLSKSTLKLRSAQLRKLSLQASPSA